MSSAFPNGELRDLNGEPVWHGQEGLTKREWLAARCPEDEMNQLCNWTELAAYLGKEVHKITVGEFLEARCRARYLWADAMLKLSNETWRDVL